MGIDIWIFCVGCVETADYTRETIWNEPAKATVWCREGVALSRFTFAVPCWHGSRCRASATYVRFTALFMPQRVDWIGVGGAEGLQADGADGQRQGNPAG